MKTISRDDMLSKYGIDLPPGRYNISINDGFYDISKVYDDTEGCLLPGENKVVGKVINSKYYEKLIIQKIKKAGGKILLTIE